MTEPKHEIIIGLDLGQAKDPTALAILEKVTNTIERPNIRIPWKRTEETQPPYFHCKHLDRLPLKTSYPDIVAHVQTVLRLPEFKDAYLVVDATGVGRPVVDMLHNAGLSPIGVTITSGDSESYSEGLCRVPKRNLVSIVSILLQEKRLIIGADLPHAATLTKELLNFHVTINDKAHDSYGAWREGVHDDLVLAVALAAWHGNKCGITVEASAQELLDSL
jgi:hypothetical protein